MMRQKKRAFFRNRGRVPRQAYWCGMHGLGQQKWL